uniref:Uncharacterized protein n=1 Tax=Strigamia maritima TaxID=126957 RepID=T1JLB8_STRMM
DSPFSHGVERKWFGCGSNNITVVAKFVNRLVCLPNVRNNVQCAINGMKEDNAVLSDYNHSQAVVIDFEVSFCSKQIRGHSQCHCHYTRGHNSNLQANDKVFHARFSREAIAQRIALLEHDRFRRDLAYNSGGSRRFLAFHLAGKLNQVLKKMDDIS